MWAVFNIPVWQGILLLVVLVNLLGTLVVWLSRKLIVVRLTKQHERIGRLLFRVSAGLIALLISLSYANERVEFNRVRDSLEHEASLITNVFIKLELHHSATADSMHVLLKKYVELTIDDHWEQANANPYYSSIAQTMGALAALALDLPENDKRQAVLKAQVIEEVNQMVNLMQVRFYAKHALFPFLVYVLGIGMLFMWMFFAVYNPDVISLFFLGLYNSFLVLLIYFIIVLSNPLVGVLRIEPDAFKVLKNKGIDVYFDQK